MNCFVIGETGMAVRCVEILLAKGLGVRGVISDDPLVERSARQLDLCVYHPKDDDIRAVLAAQPFDLLFSVINSHILAQEILALPRLAAINYHDSPLPAYAGLNATSWAIINGEREHGVSWHLMESGIDTGDIVKSGRVPIQHDDTAQTLNLRCTEIAIQIFDSLVDDLVQSQLARTPQRVTGRSYFGLYDRPYGAGFLRWTDSVDESCRLSRGLLFGATDNPLCLPKFLFRQQIFSFRSVEHAKGLEHSHADASSEPGQGFVEQARPPTIVVRCKDGWLRLKDVYCVDPDGLSLVELLGSEDADEASEQPGFGEKKLPTLFLSYPFDLDSLESIYRVGVRSEGFWINRLRDAEALELPLLGSGRLLKTVDIRDTTVDHDGVAAGCSHASIDIREDDSGIRPLTLLALFLARLTHRNTFDIPYRHGTWPGGVLGSCFVKPLPLHIRCDFDMRVSELIARTDESLSKTLRRQPPIADIFCRFAGVSPLPPAPFLVEASDRVTTVVFADRGLAQRFAKGLEDFRTNLKRALSSLSTPQIPNAQQAVATAEEDAPKLGDIPLTSERDRIRIMREWNATFRPYDLEKTHFQHFLQRVPRFKERTAVRFQGVELTYGELLARVISIAGALIRLDLPPNSVIAVMAQRNLALVPALLGIHGAGHGYLPLEYGRYPAARLKQILADAGVSYVLMLDAEAPAEESDVSPATCLTIHDLFVEADAYAADHATVLASCDRAQDPRNTAYLMYTSGSTGTPKGVMISQRNLVNHNLAVIDDFELTEHDRVLQFGALGFDLSVEEIFPILLTGGTLVLLEEGLKESPRDFFEFLRREGVTMLDLPTAYWHALVGMLESENLPENIRLVVIGGEKASETHYLRWSEKTEDVRLINTYGPTETTIIATMSEDLTTIGGPIANCETYVLDSFGGLCPPGIVGDLFIAGEPVSKGYLNRPEKTAEAFMPNPFTGTDAGGSASSNAIRKDKRGALTSPMMYRTGDRASFTESGRLLYHGRSDGQVKINGFRVELGEIERAIVQQPDVREAVVVVTNYVREAAMTADRVSSADAKELAAYYVAEPSGVDPDTVLRRLKTVLPAYMIPRHVALLEAIPLNKNGKVDRAALPEPSFNPDIETGGVVGEVNSPMEIVVAMALEKVFGSQRYNPNASFSDIGGDSLSAIRLLLELEKGIGQSVPEHVNVIPTLADAFANEHCRRRRDAPASR
ncbi:MAG: amino acid adenylation domain-containing protein [Thiohalocapsa sp.]|nr:amino acid adenylation domain-containing protein [Thiohalocapsa sp.]